LNKAGRGQVWLHRFALLTAVATFPLLFVGGLVTSTGSALAVPDWPTTFGHNMFLYPWSQMVGGIFYEHSHRLLGALVGFLTIILTGWLWLGDSRPWLRWLGCVALAAVVLQGVLGGLRVVLLREILAIFHACLAQAFFALLASIALFTSPGWQAGVAPTADVRRLRHLCLVTTALIYGQIVAGAVLRHTGLRLDAHVVLAILVSLHVLLLVARVGRQHADHVSFVRPTVLLAGLLGLQLALGVGAYLVRFTAVGFTLSAGLRVGVTTTHLAVGSLMLITALVLTLRAYRGVPLPRPAMAGTLIAEQVSP
jgi:cytochrome c oxidase assembly protein subunit 15